MKLKKIIISLSLLFALFLPITIYAQSTILNNDLIAEAACTKGGTCTVNTFLRLGISVANFILGIVGALTLVMFIYGGFTWILSGGSSEQVKKGRDIIVGSVVGLLIVFSSYLIISYVTNDILGAKINNNGALQPAFTGNLPADNKKESTQPGAKCSVDYKGTCATSCDSDKASTQSDCVKGKVCCYDNIPPVDTDCSSTNPGSRCRLPATCQGSSTILSPADPGCSQEGYVCCSN